QTLLALHNFLVEDVTEKQPIQTDAQGRQYRENSYELVSPHGSRRSFSAEQLSAFFEQIDDYVEMLAAFQFRRLEDTATGKFDWRV
ncbi:MAG: hypothetical protein LUD80_01300, partial [Clostridiales bacterium]|nr:hypothetical protein [Clostridiales bacterium]